MVVHRLNGRARVMVQPMLRALPDERLVGLAQAGHDRAFETLVARYRSALLAYASRLVGPDRAEDVLQQATLALHRAIEREQELKVEPWLYRVVRNGCLDVLKARAGSDLPLNAELIDRADVEDTVDRRMQLQATVAALGDLPATQRDALVQAELGGRSHSEIAAMLNVSPGAVRQLIHRGRGALRHGAGLLLAPALVARLLARPEAAAAAAPAASAGGSALLTKAAAALVASGALAAVSVPVIAGDDGRAGAATHSARPAQPSMQQAAETSAPPSPGADEPESRRSRKKDRRRSEAAESDGRRRRRPTAGPAGGGGERPEARRRGDRADEPDEPDERVEPVEPDDEAPEPAEAVEPDDLADGQAPTTGPAPTPEDLAPPERADD